MKEPKWIRWGMQFLKHAMPLIFLVLALAALKDGQNTVVALSILTAPVPYIVALALKRLSKKLSASANTLYWDNHLDRTASDWDPDWERPTLPFGEQFYATLVYGHDTLLCDPPTIAA